MNLFQDFFTDLGFDFDKTLSKPNKDFLSEKLALKEKLKGKVYFYQNNNQANTSFYLITIPLPEEDFNYLRKYIWNENKADLLFYSVKNPKSNTLFEDEIKFELFYAKVSPLIKIDDCRIDSFSSSAKDVEKIKAINRWQFDSGAFWLNYSTFLGKINKKGIDKELVGTLKSLKSSLNITLKQVEKSEKLREEIVQALIDRTLYIKYLEDNHIINSYFYAHYFKSEDVDYKFLLEKYRKNDLNKLFKIIHAIFNNSLFDKPLIDAKYLTTEVCTLLYQSISGTNAHTKQLRLFDFQFNIIPVEFVSYIYEIFLSEKQQEGGIFYTPKKLAQLILDDVIPNNEIGKVLDPSCGSGMFLIIAYQKLLENSQKKQFKDIEHEISFRIKLLTDNIFGIEKEITAQRFTLFSLSLQLLRGLDPIKIKTYIEEQLKENKEITLFKEHSYFENIICANSLDQNEVPFKSKTFDFIVGNPPFFEIKRADNEISFLDKFDVELKDKTLKAKEIVGKHQISQCFLIKIRDWSNENTRFGFVSNSSNFYNDNSKQFQDFFYYNYNIEKIYELSKVKKILFEKAKESVVALIFNNQKNKKNVIDYYPVEMGLFSEKPFELLIIQEDKVIHLKQADLISNSIILRNFLIGNNFDLELLNNFSSYERLSSYLKIIEGTNSIVNNGLQIVGKEQLVTEFNISKNQWEKLTKQDREDLSIRFKNKYSQTIKSRKFPTPLIEPKELANFTVVNSRKFLGDISNFQRTRNEKIYTESKILINRTGKLLKGVYFDKKIYYNFDIYSVFLKDEILCYLITAIINSNLINYFVDLLYRKRADSSYPKIGHDAIENIPIPKELDEYLVKKISKISKELTEGKYQYDDKVAFKLNELIYDLYDLSYIEKQRIRDYFKSEEKVTNTKNELELYKTTLIDTIQMYFKNKINIEFSNSNINPVVAKIILNKDNKKEDNTATAKKTAYYLLNEIFKQNPSENFLASQEKIYGKECVYIIKKNVNTNWSETKAYEDGQEILKHIR